MDFLNLAKSRESTRHYVKTPVAREKILQCLDAARFAPSACNSQPWKFVVVDDEKLLEQLRPLLQDEILPINRFTRNCTAFLAVVEEETHIADKQKFAPFDLGLAVENFCLQAEAMDLGTCIIGWFQEDKIKELLQVPEERRIRVMVAVGKKEDHPQREKVRKSLEETVCFNCYE